MWLLLIQFFTSGSFIVYSGRFLSISLPKMLENLRKFSFLPPVKEPSAKVYQAVLQKYPKYREEEKEQTLEYRDEAKRSKWAFFDEYEYRQTPVKSLKRFGWFDPEDTPAERRLILKLDVILTAFCFVVYWIKYLDQSNINNAYVSGMKEDLDFKGNDLVTTQAMYSAGAIIFQLPFLYIIPKFPNNYILPVMDFGWGLMTLLLYKAKSPGGVQALRFFVGAFEAAWYPLMHYMLGSWLKPREINRRAGFVYCAQFLGTTTSGLLAAAATTHLHEYLGHKGWQWLFILDGIITLPVGLLGIWILPGTPHRCTSIFLTEEEIVLARERLRRGPNDTHQLQLFDKQLWKNILNSWKLWIPLATGIAFWCCCQIPSSGAFILWLHSLGRYNSAQVNNMSTIAPALGIAWVAIVVTIADYGNRWMAIVFAELWVIIGAVILAVWYVPESAKWLAWCTSYFALSMSASLYSWINDICRHNAQERAIILLLVNTVAQTCQTWTSVLVFKTVESPRFLKGYCFCAAFSLILVGMVFVMLFFYKRQERKDARLNGIVLYNSTLVESMDTAEVSESDGKTDFKVDKYSI
ncbi:major facilitator superfamily domain-containing protein [Yarrowia lipolytica]|jgi:MFS family permease|uniref:Major facilitator superfamily domain-containing protein n=1 Tax=Yarrowia lipolytica TaxID=4952 RepID=A0A371BXL1_YARLL|nr:major facilitator superfamily domain-containing protein [Yarrowia lipolytica]RDW29579.1 major facilitator superfamily domain-containing protein [Yarrowia lipolytica]RDW36517.1 major facilitator superfamily domain-containing protein [Yarrowia lipolytica]SEI33973.1 YALIA101S04e07140g1_1 [Yarrowia lipolytica]VBB89269.1 Permease, putative [Yarrowia lipolytica]